jgi:tetratricopeptide (TPR) repeat protein
MKLASFLNIFKPRKSESIHRRRDAQNDGSNQHDAKTLVASGIVKTEAKDYIGALETFDRAIKIEPHHPMAYMQRSKVKSILKDHAGAERDLKQAEVLLEQTDKALLALGHGRTKYNAGDYVGAITALDTVFQYAFTIHSLIHEVYNLRGLAKKALEDFTGAFEDFNQAIEANVCYAEAFYERGLIRTHRLNDDEGALEDFDKAIELEPSYVDAYYSRAVLKATLKDTEGALQDLSEAIRLDPTDARLFFNRAMRKSEMQDYDGAIQDLSVFIELAPTNTIVTIADAYSLRGMQRGVLKDYNAAIKDQSKAIELNPFFTAAYLSRGQERAWSGDHQGAMLDFSKVIELEPSNADAYHSRGLLQIEIGMEVEGRKDLVKAIDLGYEE